MKTVKIAAFALLAGAVVVGVAAPANAASATMYGDPAAAARYWQPQQYDDCVLMSSADVIGEITGEAPSEEVIIARAQSIRSVAHPGPIYTKPADPASRNPDGGVSMEDIPPLLSQYKIKAVLIEKDDGPVGDIAPGMSGLEQALGGGHKVIVSLNGELIWNLPVEDKDKNGNPQSNHAVVVTGVDTANGIVHLNDSGAEDGRDEQVPLGVFVRAWDTSDDVMVVTV